MFVNILIFKYGSIGTLSLSGTNPKAEIISSFHADLSNRTAIGVIHSRSKNHVPLSHPKSSCGESSILIVCPSDYDHHSHSLPCGWSLWFVIIWMGSTRITWSHLAQTLSHSRQLVQKYAFRKSYTRRRGVGCYNDSATSTTLSGGTAWSAAGSAISLCLQTEKTERVRL